MPCILALFGGIVIGGAQNLQLRLEASDDLAEWAEIPSGAITMRNGLLQVSPIQEHRFFRLALTPASAVALEKVKNYSATNGTPSSEPPTLADYMDLQVKGVTSTNLDLVNLEISKHEPNEVDTSGKIQSIVDQVLLGAINNGDSSMLLLRVKGTADQAEWNEVPFEIDALRKGLLRIPAGPQEQFYQLELVTAPKVALEKVKAFVESGGGNPAKAPNLGDYADLGINGVTTANLISINQEIAGCRASEVDSVLKIQSIINRVNGVPNWQLVKSQDIGIGVENPNGATGNALSTGKDSTGNEWCIIGDQMRAAAAGADVAQGQVHIIKNGNLHQVLTDQGGDATAWGGWFGYRVSVDWTAMRIAVGSTHAINSITGGEGDVQTFLYDSEADEWKFEQYIQHPDTRRYDEFGGPMELSGNWMIVGAPYHSPYVYREGSVYFYELVDGVWTSRQKFSPETAQNSRFGAPVAICGRWAMVNSRDNPNGKVYVFHLNGGQWVQHSILTPRNPRVEGEGFGWPISIWSERTAVIGGAMRNSTIHRGGVYFFELEGNGWNEKSFYKWPDTQTEVPPINPNGDFPNYAHVSGNLAVIGGPYVDATNWSNPMLSDGKGRAVVFTRNAADNTWSYLETLSPPLEQGDWHGASCYTDGTRIWTLAPGVSSPSKSIRLFNWTPNN